VAMPLPMPSPVLSDSFDGASPLCTEPFKGAKAHRGQLGGPLVRVVRLHAPGDARLEEVPPREPGPDDVVVRIAAAGLCGSDLHAWRGTTPASVPVIMGHEGAGTVRQVGARVTRWRPGDHVVVDYQGPCGRCDPCARGRLNLCEQPRWYGFKTDGTFTEELCLPAAHLVELPVAVPFEVGALAGCAGVTAYHAVERTHLTAGQSCAVVACGGVGAAVILMARLAGAAPLVAIDPLPEKRALALQLGADAAVDPGDPDYPQALRKALGATGAQVVFEVLGKKVTRELALRAAAPGGTIALMGLPFGEFEDALQRAPTEATVVLPMDHTVAELQATLKLIAQGRFPLERLVTHRRPLTEALDAFMQLEDQVGRPLRIVLEP